MRLPGPVRIGWESVKANAVPMVVLWLLAAALVGGYFLVPGVAAGLEPLRDWMERSVWEGAVASQVVFSGLLPLVFYTMVRSIRPRANALTCVLQASNLFYNRTLEYPCADVNRCLDYYKTLGEKIPNEWKDVTAFDRAWLKASFGDARKWSLANPDKVLWFGEFGTIRHAPKASRVNYMRDSVSIAKEYGFPYCVWNYLSTPNDGNRFSLVDDDTRKFLSRDLLDACLGK